jgi:hypothetical protein
MVNYRCNGLTRDWMAMKTLLHPVKRALIGLIVWLIPRLLKFPGVMQGAHFKQWEAQAFHITPVHFYQPIPDTRELAKRYPPRSALPGIAWQPDAQLALLDRLSAFAPDTGSFLKAESTPDRFHLDNGQFVGIDPHLYYCMVRHFKPARIVEVGAGFSTLAAAEAARHTETRIIAVEPYPRPFIAEGAQGIEHIGKKAEDVGTEFFMELQAGDMLFIDSSHVVRTGGDVTFLMLEVLPRLAAGVIIHLHDIFLPDEYPSQWPLKNHWFWTEQYLVQAYLIDNARMEVLLGSQWLTTEHAARMREIFPDALAWTGGSLWLRTL